MRSLRNWFIGGGPYQRGGNWPALIAASPEFVKVATQRTGVEAGRTFAVQVGGVSKKEEKK